MQDNRIERINYKGAPAIVILNRDQKQKMLKQLSENPDLVLDLILLPSNAEVTITFKIGGFTDRVKPIVFETANCENP